MGSGQFAGRWDDDLSNFLVFVSSCWSNFLVWAFPRLRCVSAAARSFQSTEPCHGAVISGIGFPFASSRLLSITQSLSSIRMVVPRAPVAMLHPELTRASRYRSEHKVSTPSVGSFVSRRRIAKVPPLNNHCPYISTDYRAFPTRLVPFFLFKFRL